MLRFPRRTRTRSPFFATSGAVPGHARLLYVNVLKSSITMGFGRDVPGGIAHSARKMAKSRSTGSGARGWTMRNPIIPSASCTISSEWGWYISVPCCRSVNSYDVGLTRQDVRLREARDAVHAVRQEHAVPVNARPLR
jgi:hypothetical protein